MLWSFLVLLFTSLTFTAGNSIDCNESLKCPYLITRTSSHGITVYSGDPFYLNASVYDCCNVSYIWKYDLQACIISGPASFDNDVYQQCTTITYDQYYCYDNYHTYSHYITLYYNTTLVNVTDSSEVLLLIQTQWPIIETIQSNLSVFLSSQMCTDSRSKVCIDYGNPINHLMSYSCDQCKHDRLSGWVMFTIIQLLPLTVVVLIIIVFNIQLTNGFMIGFVFYCQMISIVYPNLRLNFAVETSFQYNNKCSPSFYIIPGNIFNLNFLMFTYKPLCIMSNLTLLQTISFWYIIPTYTLVLLLLIYIWTTMYDKGFRCVITITRPLHWLLAHFWSMTNTDPSLIHSIASIYLLCFTQFATTSLQLLYPHVLFYNYFGWPHSFAGIFAIIVLVFIIFLPMLYIQLYPFKLFHKSLSYLHLRKEILISLGDVFTGPYKNGSKNTRDYRYFAGFYLLLRIIILCLYFIPKDSYIILYSQVGLFVAFGGTIMLFRPYKQNVHSFFDLLFMLFLATLNIVTITLGDSFCC